MKTCSYCGNQYPDDAAACPIDGQALGQGTEAVKTADVAVAPRFCCPSCGTADDYSPAVELRGSFSVPLFLLGGIFTVMLRNASRPKRVKCNKCGELFDIRPPVAMVWTFLFWGAMAFIIYVLVMALVRSFS